MTALAVAVTLLLLHGLGVCGRGVGGRGDDHVKRFRWLDAGMEKHAGLMDGRMGGEVVGEGEGVHVHLRRRLHLHLVRLDVRLLAQPHRLMMVMMMAHSCRRRLLLLLMVMRVADLTTHHA